MMANNARDAEGWLQSMGFALDEGDRIDGPFVPDGVTRIYDPDTIRVLAEGSCLEEAWERFMLCTR